MGQRSRRRNRPAAPTPKPVPTSPPAPSAAEERMARGYARGRAKDEEARRNLVPLAPGERPVAVTVAALVALTLALANVAVALTGRNITGDDGEAVTSTIATTVILVVAGIGMLKVKYWAVLGFQALLALQIIVFSLALLRVEKWWLGLVVAGLIGALGLLFYKLVRTLARIQMPERRQ